MKEMTAKIDDGEDIDPETVSDALLSLCELRAEQLDQLYPGVYLDLYDFISRASPSRVIRFMFCGF